MANEKPDRATAEPMIRFGDSWLPAHQIWHKMEVANMATDAIERFNAKFPHLDAFQVASREIGRAHV